MTPISPAAAVATGEATRKEPRDDVPTHSMDVFAAKNGDEAAFERLYRSHVDRVYSLICRMAGVERAEELTQDVFVRAWGQLTRFRGDSKFGTWLYRITVNLVYDANRTRTRERERMVDGVVPIQQARARRDPVTERIDFDSAIEVLPHRARQVFVLHDVAGFKHREIAEMLGIADGTAKSQLHRARMLMRDQLNR